LLCLTLLVAERDLTILTGKNILLLEHTFIEIATEIEQCFSAGANSLAIGHPGLGRAGRELKSLLSDGIKQFGTEDLGRCFVIE